MAKQGTVKKQFFEVNAPFTSSKIVLYASEISELEGRTVTLDLTRILRGRSFEMKIRVKVAEGVALGEPTSLALAGSYIRRMMRTGTDYVEDSFDVECKDGKARVKPFMIARNKVSRAVRNDLRKTAKEFLVNYMRMRTAREIFNDMMTNKVQKELSFKLKKIYPLALCEIRIFELEPEKRVFLASKAEERKAEATPAKEEKKTVKKVKEEKTPESAE